MAISAASTWQVVTLKYATGGVFKSGSLVFLCLLSMAFLSCLSFMGSGSELFTFTFQILHLSRIGASFFFIWKLGVVIMLMIRRKE